jgi:diguanylate cyclase (GGDEF)-like protein
MQFLKVRSLQSKILILFLFLLILVQLISFFFTFSANRNLENTQLNNKLANAQDVFNTQFNNRRYYLSAFAETAAKDYGLKSVLEEDNRSFLVALNNHRKRINSDLAMAIDRDGVVFAQLLTYLNEQGENKVRVGKAQGQPFFKKVSLLDAQDTQLVKYEGRVYQLSLAPVKSGNRAVAWVGFGYLIDANLASELAKLTDVHVGFVVEKSTSHYAIASSDEDKYPADGEHYKTVFNNEQLEYITRVVKLGQLEGKEVSAVLFDSKADILKTVGIDWPKLILLIVLTVILSTYGALAIARSITRPVKSLVSQVKSISKGNYGESVDVSGSKELMQLSDEFNNMTSAIVSREETISYQAFHDPLSHLPNRNSLINELERRSEAGERFILIHLCYLRAEEITDTLGFQVGDEVIKEVASRVANTNLDIDSFHLGGEHFVVLANEQDVQILIDKLLDALSINCVFDNISLHMQFVCGVVISSLHNGGSESELLQKSNVAMQQAIKNKKSYQIYDPQFDQNAVERLFLTNSLKQAIEENELILFYQPKLSLDTMTVSHVEALVRWQHPEKGLIPPDSFISIAEKTGQMDKLTRWVTNTAVNQYVQWQQMGLSINIAINISAENLLDKSYPDFVIALKQKYKLSSDAITLEVTEDAVVADPKQAIEILSYLREHGFKLSIDDYGTGYSSLAQLKQLPVQELKIDRSFVQHLTEDDNDKLIVKSTVELAHNMNLSVVAEGIEDEHALIWLKEQGCQLAQGYFISRPLPADAFEQWIDNTEYNVIRTKN